MDKLIAIKELYRDRMSGYVTDKAFIHDIEVFLPSLIEELQQLRKSQLKPATKFLGNSIEDQFYHIITELDESRTEVYRLSRQIKLNSYKKDQTKLRALDELNDLQISCETLKAIIEPDENKRDESMIKTIQKNTNREGGSYYE